MGEYEPNDSRDVTQSRHSAPGEPPRTGPQEAETRRQPQQQAGETELEQDERGDEVEATHGVGELGADAQAEQALRDAAMERDAEELDEAEAGRLDRND